MKFSDLVCKLFYTICLILLSISSMLGQTPKDLVNGNLIQFNDNGFWCWYQDERAVVDTVNGKILLGSAASSSGFGGSPRNGANDAIIFDLQSDTLKRYILNQWSGNCDDHNTAGFALRPDGKYIAMYDQHYDNNVTRYRIFDGNTWAAEQTYDWRTKPGGIDYTLAYNNIYYLSAEGKMYDFQRANHRAPNFLVSTNMGDTWTWGGQLTTNYSTSYNKGYYKYWSNGVDRIDFIFTEQHPRDTTTSIYHGYIMGGKSYKSDGTLVDNDIYDTTHIPTFLEFTKVFADSTIMGNDAMRRCWQTDVVRYDDGTIATIITARVNNNVGGGSTSVDPDHNFIYCRYNGSAWSYTFLAKAGKKMYSSEQDYTGLAALCPNDPNTIYISTPYSPIDTTINLTVREIWKGTTTDNGAHWSWAPITENSVRNNFRPIVPAWDNNNTALLWCRGSYTSAQNYDMAVVGILDRKLELINNKIFVDADTLNTTLVNGSAFTHTGPDANVGSNSDNQWHIRTGIGTNYVLTSSENTGTGENSPVLKTRVTVPDTGTYDVWANFWGLPTTAANWRIRAGFSTGNMQIFRSMASKEVNASDYYTPPVLSNGSNFLYQAYIGRVHVSGSNTFEVFIDDSATAVGGTSLQGDANRTWYDGISYAGLDHVPAAPVFAISPNNIDFNEIPVGSSKKDSVRVSNTGTSDLQITSISSTNGRFTFTPSKMTIAPFRSAYLAVTFAPQDTIAQAGSIILAHNAEGSPDTVMVNGKGIMTPVFSVSPNSIDFSEVEVGSIKKDSVRVDNSGMDTLRVTDISSTNGRFTFTPSTMTIAPFGSAYLVITFTPQDTTTQSSSIILTHNAEDSPDTVIVNGKGIPVPAPVFFISSDRIDFGVIDAGSVKEDSVNIVNSGTDTLKVTDILSTNGRFTVEPSTMTIAPSGSTYLVVTFAPDDTLSQSGVIILTHNAEGSPDTVAVSGKGIPQVGVKDLANIPARYELGQNYPNPFNPSTMISYSIPKSGLVSLVVFDVLGREIQTLVNKYQEPNNYSINFNAQGLRSGAYFVRLVVREHAGSVVYSKVNKILLVK